MSKTIFITGASSGIGKETALRFQSEGWNVVATMRNPLDGAELSQLDNVLITSLDVLDEASITSSVAAATQRFGAIDVLLNNAGYGAYGTLESFDLAGIRRQFETNVIGLLAVTKAVLPGMRNRKTGTIINISSIGGRMTFPLGTLYHGTKFAVEGLSESLHFELEALGVRVKIIEPGLIQTDFGGRSFDFRNDDALTEYQSLVAGVVSGFAAMGAQASSPPSVVADVIFEAATDDSSKLRYTAGSDAEDLLKSRRFLDDDTFFSQLKVRMLNN
ncbi:SDR family oxidoreductase [Serratia liquefaciens]|uniref:SDR family oxidoreductase n=1 Tax=Serratia liquefaciens TaxID=614 RepID=UPI0004AC1793|nr:SDR family oxidoreductase [Serratia liquefaciens]GAK29502.1 short-chain dehydrogenase [Serratia liquefaciens FK01]